LRQRCEKCLIQRRARQWREHAWNYDRRYRSRSIWTSCFEFTALWSDERAALRLFPFCILTCALCNLTCHRRRSAKTARRPQVKMQSAKVKMQNEDERDANWYLSRFNVVCASALNPSMTAPT